MERADDDKNNGVREKDQRRYINIDTIYKQETDGLERAKDKQSVE